MPVEVAGVVDQVEVVVADLEAEVRRAVVDQVAAEVAADQVAVADRLAVAEVVQANADNTSHHQLLYALNSQSTYVQGTPANCRR